MEIIKRNDGLDYHADTSRISKSGLDKINISPAHYWASYLDPNRRPEKRESYFEIGDVFHCMVLEPHLFTKRYHVVPHKLDRRYREDKIMWKRYDEASGDKLLLNKDVYDDACRMFDSIFSNPIVEHLFSVGIAEKVFHFDHPEFGEPCKCRPDWVHPSNIVVDLKSCDDASPAGFRKSVRNFRYYVQDPFYRMGIYEAEGWYPEQFIFIACEKEPPYAFGLYTLDREDTIRGESEIARNMDTYSRCLKEGKWPGYSPRIQTLKIF